MYCFLRKVVIEGMAVSMTADKPCPQLQPSLLLSIGVDNSGAGQQNNFFIFGPHFSIEKLPQNATKHPVA
jgi:hypothetical protein